MFLNKGGQIKTRYKEEFFYHKGGDTLEGVAQSGSGGLFPGNIQGQVAWCSEQHGLFEDIPAHCRGLSYMASEGPFQPKALCDSVLLRHSHPLVHIQVYIQDRIISLQIYIKRVFFKLITFFKKYVYVYNSALKGLHLGLGEVGLGIKQKAFYLLCRDTFFSFSQVAISIVLILHL